ncbi:LOW QUALITY PROTEIN: translocon at the outer membrane of chloroplasts 64-like [Dioscorea cayenensis subsp. rotundata]|uniref:LOW QUALITY PROTEIN: translocon at the outer membrane of chloroplasts 64-like n=1 Tax=Dioscorea cayennensis subsp. rotundata TaxID=55577 RepID=A0AB40AI19_DIOCR|nr:LOW QUALITY PROTEIN: translocon at the outer membrane of chloroplasts 64-like [Dioscorea cayenensis subsp. rotundata]
MSSSANLWVLLGLGLAGIVMMTRRLKRAIKEDFGAFIERFELLPPAPPPPPKAPHPLTGLTFAVADIFDINGYVTGFGNQDWMRTHEPAEWTSPVVSSLIEAGATCVGKTVIDEMGYGITGENKHFDTPTNPVAHDRIPGGSSSGSGVAVAGGLVDFSLGVDTIGGVRIPAAFCGILGFRPSHESVSSTGIIPVSPSIDTTGWFAKDPSIVRRVGHVLLRLPYANMCQPRRVIIADDCFQLSKIPANRIIRVVTKSTEKLFGRQVINHIKLADHLASMVPSLKQLLKLNGNGDMKTSSLKSLADAMKLLHSLEFKDKHAEWINCNKTTVGSCISAQLDASLNANDRHIDHCHSVRNEVRSAMNALLKDDGILVLPSIPQPPSKLNSKEVLSEDYQTRFFSLLAIASMSGCCQVAIPLGFHEKSPVSVSFIARHGGDRLLLDTIEAAYATLQEQADIVTKSNLSSSREELAEMAKEKGNTAFKEKQWQKAIGFYSEAIKLNGNSATYYSNRAAAYLEVGSYLQAETDCTAAISLDKKNVKAYLRRGTAREMLGYYKEAIEDFKYALVLEPTNKTANLACNRLKKLFQ